jgi:protein SCO1/2
MSHRKIIASGALLKAALAGVALGAGLGLRPALAAGAAGTGQDHDAHHHHHEVPSGIRRSVASYLVPDVMLVDQHGRRVAVRDLLATDKPLLMNFIFTTCTAICPVMTATFGQVQQGLAEDRDKVRMVSISIDPEQDTPAALTAYAKRFSAGPQWVFLTGSLEDTIAVQEAFGAYRGDKMNHVPLTLLRAGPEAPWVRYDGFAAAGDLVKEVRATVGD